MLLTLRRRHGRELFQLTLHRCQVSIDGLFQQALLLDIEGFGLGGELQPLEHGHLVRELVDGGLLECDLVVAACDLELVGCSPSPQGEDQLAQLLRVQVVKVDRRAWRQRERDELGLRVAGLRGDASRVDHAAPLVNEVGVEAMGQRHLSHRRPGLCARRQHLPLQIGRVAPPAHALGVFHRCPPKSLADTIVIDTAAKLKTGSPRAYRGSAP